MKVAGLSHKRATGDAARTTCCLFPARHGSHSRRRVCASIPRSPPDGSRFCFPGRSCLLHQSCSIAFCGPLHPARHKPAAGVCHRFLFLHEDRSWPNRETLHQICSKFPCVSLPCPPWVFYMLRRLTQFGRDPHPRYPARSPKIEGQYAGAYRVIAAKGGSSCARHHDNAYFRERGQQFRVLPQIWCRAGCLHFMQRGPFFVKGLAWLDHTSVA